jgi:CheY-like chemotaxis protein
MRGATAINAFRPSHAHTLHERRSLADALSILVVDGNPMVREATAWTLAAAGHHVTEATDGVAALEYLEQYGQCDLIIADLTMPRMGGMALSEAVRKQWPDLPVLLVSGRQQPRGVKSVMMKPFGPDALLHAVAEIVGATERGHRIGL